MTNGLKKDTILEKVLVEEAVSEGKSLARIDKLVVFIEGGVPGDVADLKITKVKSNYAEARVVYIHTPSEHRLTPFCEHFGTCGGCIWQHMDYEMQLVYKQRQVEDVLKRLGKVELPEGLPIIRSEKTQYYRNRLDFAFSNRRWLTKEEMLNPAIPLKDRLHDADSLEGIATKQILPSDAGALGFHVPKRFDKILDVKKCWLQEDQSNKIRLAIKEIAIKNSLSFYDVIKQEGFLRNVIIRNTTTGEWMAIVVFHYDQKEERESLLSELYDRFPQLTSLLYIINPKKNDTVSDLAVHIFRGKDHITEIMNLNSKSDKKLAFKISAKSFYQTNSEQAVKLYKVAKEFASLKGNELVYDLYTGAGTIANFVADKAKKVIGIDYISDAIEDAKENSASNEIYNTEFFAGDLKDIFTIEFIELHGKPDLVITDPPRSGMHPDVVNRLIEILPDRIVYVSCNPATQARDINLLSSNYKIEKLQTVDMFPHTSHVENVALLVKQS